MTSRYSFDSLDHLWADERRLSEAGVRRSSNDSTPSLYESSDTFIIGDRIYVGGSIPGKIAYIGETKFGPGDWAGIVLDEAVGKNDGTVGGFRYFQCEPKHGIFSRLNRITRTQLYPYSPPTSIERDRPTSRNSSIDEGGRYSPFKKTSFDGLFSSPSRKSSSDRLDGGLFSSPTRSSPLTDYGGLFSRKSSGDSYSGRKSSSSNNTYTPMSYYGRESSPQRYQPSPNSGRESPTHQHRYSSSTTASRERYESPPRYSSEPQRRQSPTRQSYASPTRPSYASPTRPSYASPTRPSYASEHPYDHYGNHEHHDHVHHNHQSTTSSTRNQKHFTVGDRVIIRSSQGSKSGVLRYKGDTYFADGEWCGVELDDPLGKNDGSVSGYRYFYCEPKFGVFAPLSKVSKSPVSAAKLHNKCCVVHPNKDTPIVSTIVKEVKPQPGTRPFMEKTTTTVYERKAPPGAKPVQQIHQIKGYNHAWDADCY